MTDAQLIGLNLQVEKLNRLKEDLTCLCPVFLTFLDMLLEPCLILGSLKHTSRKGSDDLRPVSSNF